jgi:hypothetical protein
MLEIALEVVWIGLLYRNVLVQSASQYQQVLDRAILLRLGHLREDKFVALLLEVILGSKVAVSWHETFSDVNRIPRNNATLFYKMPRAKLIDLSES